MDLRWISDGSCSRRFTSICQRIDYVIDKVLLRLQKEGESNEREKQEKEIFKDFSLSMHKRGS